MSFHDRPIGIFDSGVGGLTVLRALRERLPSESLLYLGDTARLPYGTKSPETIARYAVQAAGLPAFFVPAQRTPFFLTATMYLLNGLTIRWMMAAGM